MLTWGVGLLIVAVAGSGLGTPCDSDTETSRIRTALFVDLGLAAIHILFAIYIHNKLNKPNDQGEDLLTAGSADAETGGHSGLAGRAWHIVLYDIVFCIYAPVLAGSFVFGWVEVGWFVSGDCNGNNGMALAAGVLLIMYGMLAPSYLCCWGCCVSIIGLTGDTFFGRISSRAVRGGGQGSAAMPGITGAAPSAPPGEPVLVAQPVLAQPVRATPV